MTGSTGFCSKSDEKKRHLDSLSSLAGLLKLQLAGNIVGPFALTSNSLSPKAQMKHSISFKKK